ncbi:DUF6632 domain-containing protein [Microbulbifer sp. 2304DJ12-6]|uniref:DUF6632 domain-containing protein n=1 Tax=Microbulbifer sp. 2304DJ12-6 TaxID=3233340 RepID=UPI0039AFC471
MYPLMRLGWLAGWGFAPPYQEFQIITLVMYATLGIFLILSARNFAVNISLIWFTIWLNLISGSVMLVMVVANRIAEIIWGGNIIVQYLITGVLWYLIHKNVKLLQRQDSNGK